MPTPSRVDQKEQGLDRLLEQFKDKPNIRGTLGAYLSQTKGVEDLYFDLIENRGLETASGVQLDILGNLFGESRNGKSDEEYLKAIKFTISIDNSKATPDYLMSIVKEFTESTTVNYFQHQPACYQITFDGDVIPDSILDKVIKASPATVNVGLIHSLGGKGIIPSEDGATGTEADKGVFPESDALSGYFPSEGYQEEILSGSLPTQEIDFNLSEVFSVDLYEGTLSDNDIVNGIDLNTYNGSLLSWKTSSSGYVNYYSDEFNSGAGGLKFWFDSSGSLFPSGTVNFNFDGYSFDATTNSAINSNGQNYVGVTLRNRVGFHQKFTYTGDGSISREIPHNLGFKPCFTMVQYTSSGGRCGYRIKGMPIDVAYTNNSSRQAAGLWGGKEPTDKFIYVGQVGGDVSLNNDGVEYEVTLIADNPEQGITCGSYVADGNDNFSFDTTNKVGLLGIVSYNGAINFYTYNTGIDVKDTFLTSTNNLYLNTFNQGENNSVRLAASNVFTNTAGRTYYWFNIADPTT